MKKVILFDADGVVLESNGYFTVHVSQKYGLPVEKITPFFKGPFQECQRGEGDLKEKIAPYLKEFGWTGSVDDYLGEWFSTDASLSGDAVLNIAELREEGYLCCLASDQEKYRGEFLTNAFHFKDIFDELFLSYELGVGKADPKFFKLACEKLGVNPEDVFYFDDEQKNVDSARSVGVRGFLFEGWDRVAASLESGG